MQARYYDPVIGRFLSSDPVGFVEGGPGYFNRYAYTFNDPVNHIDAYGTCVGPALVPCVAVGGRLLIAGARAAARALRARPQRPMPPVVVPQPLNTDAANPPGSRGSILTPGGREVAHGADTQGYLDKKGWSPEMIDQVLDNPDEVYENEDPNHRTGESQSTYTDGDGNWVVVDEAGRITQVNERGNDRQPQPDRRRDNEEDEEDRG